MEVYILDSLLRRDRVIDRFESLIWTERFTSSGDFQLVTRSTVESRSLLKTGVQLAMNESYRVMTIETLDDGTDDDGKRTLTVTGNSVESTMIDRVAKAALAGNAPWTFTLTPAAAMRKIFHDICVTSVLSPAPYFYDKIPFVTEGVHPLMPASNIAEPVDPIAYSIEPTSVYDAIKQIGDQWNLGFRLLRNDNPALLYWDVYAGTNRTSGQTTKPAVIFSPELDNLTNTKELNSIESSKNVALVSAPNGYQWVYPTGVDPTTAGFERRVLYVDANDITLAAGAALDTALLQRGQQELALNRSLQAFDGEINQHSQYKYQRDYWLGDLVEVRNVDGLANQMRVTEQIFVSDKEGERSYPTLAINQFINTGSWLSEGVKTWGDYDLLATAWADKP